MSKWTKFIPDGKGGYDAFEDWGMGEEVMYQGGWKIITAIFGGFFFSLIAAPVLLLIYPMDSHRHRYEITIAGIIMTVMFLLDYLFGGIMWALFTHEGNANLISALEFFAALNTSLLVVYIILYFGYKEITSALPEITPSPIFWGAIIALVYFVLYPLFDKMLAGNYSDSLIWFLEYFK